jgi:twitching motility protein PilT
VAAYEFMVVTPAISNLIRENKVYRIESSIQIGKKIGMQLLDDHLWDLWENELIALETMIDLARNPGELLEKAQKKMGTSMKGKLKGKGLDDEYGPVLKTS